MIKRAYLWIHEQHGIASHGQHSRIRMRIKREDR